MSNTPPELVIVGAGPVGNWTGVQHLKRAPDAAVTLYERKPVYSRDHGLTIGRESFMQWSDVGPDNVQFLTEIYNAQANCAVAINPERVTAPDLSGLQGGRFETWRALPKLLDIRNLDFERITRNEVCRLGAKVNIEEVASPEEVMDRHPNCSNFVAADGAHSKMRTALWGKDCLIERDIYPSLDFNYASHGQAGYLRVNTYDKLAHVYAENIGIATNGQSSINLRFIVSPEEYNALPEANFRRPLIVTPDAPFWQGLPTSRWYGRNLQQDFYDLMALRAQHAREEPTDDPIRMTKIMLSKYRAKEFATSVMHKGRKVNWYLVGDAAMGMPFYRSINSGLILGSQLAYLLNANWVPEAARTGVYNYYTRPFRVTREFARGAKTEARIVFYKNVCRPLMYKVAQTPAAPLVRVPANVALKHLKLGKTS
jgi:2-polyprenyl-6-methoxyphenol hydroxylase-like FAD-dependent oxidoreductase